MRLRRRLAELEERVAALEAEPDDEEPEVPVWPKMPPKYHHGGEPVDAQALWREQVGEFAHYYEDSDEWSGYL